MAAAKPRRSVDRNNNGVDFERYVFVGSIPKNCTKSELIEALSFIGEIDDVSLHDKDPNNENHSKFAFVSFISPADRNRAMRLDGQIFVGGKALHVEERKPKEDAFPDSAEEEWDDLLKDFEWRKAAAVYVFRHRTMEDYLAEFLHTYACIRRVDKDHIENLSHLLTKMCETKPVGTEQMIPPNLSGMIVNMKSRNRRKWELKGLRDLLNNRPDLFRLTDNTVHYTGRMMRLKEAIDHLREITVEGLFIYFLAKFSNGLPFDIKFSFYARSEPIRTILLTLMGKSSTDVALHSYFNLMSEVFHYDSEGRKLHLLVDYFHGPNLRSLKPYLPNEFKEIFTGVGKVLEVTESEAKIKFRNKNKLEKTAQLFMDNWYCGVSELQVGVVVHFSAVLDRDRREWRCSVAWIPGKPFYNLKGRVRYVNDTSFHETNKVSCLLPDGTETLAVFEEKDAMDTVVRNQRVFVDVTPFGLNGIDYKATLLWTGIRPDEKDILQRKYKLEIKGIYDYCDRRTQRYQFDPDLPSVLQTSLAFLDDDDDNFKYDKGKRLVSDNFFRFALSNLVENSKLPELTDKKCNDIFNRLEKETINVLASIMAEHDLK